MMLAVKLIGWLRRLLSGDESDAPERLPSPDELVLLAQPGGEPEALMLRDLLEQQGIVAMVRNRDAASARGGGWGPPWAYELWVRRGDLARAREVVG